VDIELYRTLLDDQERRLLRIIKRKKENVRSIGGDSVPDAGDASFEDEVREEQARGNRGVPRIRRKRRVTGNAQRKRIRARAR